MVSGKKLILTFFPDETILKEIRKKKSKVTKLKTKKAKSVKKSALPRKAKKAKSKAK